MQAPTNGNLNISTTGSAYGQTLGTIAMPSGKWYWEVTPTTLDAVGIMAVGITLYTTDLSTYAGYESYSYVYLTDGRKANNNSFVSYGASVAVNDVIGIAFDADAGTITFYKNGVSQGTAYSSIPSNNYLPTIGDEGLSNNLAGIFNFGQRPFAYTAPSGFKALCTQNLPTPTVVQGDDYFNTVLWTGNGSSSRAITGVGFSPDMVWYKARSSAVSHRLFDSVRGANKELVPNLTDAEYTATNELLSFDSDGFTIGNESATNGNGTTFVGWSWRGSDSSPVSNTAGSITSTVSANTTSGFSVVTYTGTGSSASVGHGLGAAPQMIIVKGRTNTVSWVVYSIGLTAGYEIYLNSTNAQAVSSNFGSAPTSTVFNLGTDTNANGNGVNYVAYCFAPVAGFSAFGKYTGNGSSNGPFIYTGFRPKYLLVKISSGGNEDWMVQDTVRSPYNAATIILNPNLSESEAYYGSVPNDILSNGFKIRNATANFNTSGSTYIYAAFAENPFKYALAR